MQNQHKWQRRLRSIPSTSCTICHKAAKMCSCCRAAPAGQCSQRVREPSKPPLTIMGLYGCQLRSRTISPCHSSLSTIWPDTTSAQEAA